MNTKTPGATPSSRSAAPKKRDPSAQTPINLAGGVPAKQPNGAGDQAVNAPDLAAAPHGDERDPESPAKLRPAGRDLDLDDDPSGTLGNAHVAIRQIADDDARRIANGERRIERRTEQFQDALYDYVGERVELERKQCELLLHLEERVPHGQRTTWQQELANSLTTILGYKCAAAAIRRRITVARKGKTDRSVWDAAAVMLKEQGGRLNFRKVLQKLDGKALPEHHDAVLAQTEETAPTPEPSAPPPPVETVPVPREELARLREDASDVEHAEAVLEVLGLEDSRDPVADAKKLREENERLRAENEELRAEVARLSAGQPAGAK